PRALPPRSPSQPTTGRVWPDNQGVPAMNAFLNATANAAGDIAIVRKTYAQIEAEHQVALTALGRAEAATRLSAQARAEAEHGPRACPDHARHRGARRDARGHHCHLCRVDLGGDE